MDEIYWSFVVIGGLSIVLGIFSAPINSRLWVSAPMAAMAVGIALGPGGAGVLDPGGWPASERILEETARLTLAIGLMGIALRLPPRYFIEQRRVQGLLVGAVMPAMWLAGSALAFLFLDLPWAAAFLLGGIVTPTDPIVASSIVTSESAKRSLPERLRHALSAESGMNDGLAYLFVLLPVLLLTRTPEAALREWFLSSLLHEVAGGFVFGAVIGFCAGRLLRWAEERQFIEPISFMGYTVALALLTLGGARLLGTDGVLAVFIAGLAFDNEVGGRERAEEANIQEMVNQFFSIPIFALFGLYIPLEGWRQLGWGGSALVPAILLLRRLPAILALRPWMGELRSFRDGMFIGWFGPIGVSAMFYALLAVRRTGDETLWAAASLIIFASTIVHGVTATPLTHRYAGERKKTRTGG